MSNSDLYSILADVELELVVKLSFLSREDASSIASIYKEAFDVFKINLLKRIVK